MIFCHLIINYYITEKKRKYLYSHSFNINVK